MQIFFKFWISYFYPFFFFTHFYWLYEVGDETRLQLKCHLCAWVCVYVWVLAHHDPINIGPPLCRLALFPWVHLHHLEPSITLLLYGSRDKHDSFLSLSFCPSLFISISSYPSLSHFFCFAFCIHPSIHMNVIHVHIRRQLKKTKNNLLKSVSSSTLRCCIALITFATHTDTQTHQQASDQGYCLPLGLGVCTWLCICAFVLVCVCVFRAADWVITR